jgi:hypothetical protein
VIVTDALSTMFANDGRDPPTPPSTAGSRNSASRSFLGAMLLAMKHAPPATSNRLGRRVQDMAHDLKRMEEEFHTLNMQQIRDELKASGSD